MSPEMIEATTTKATTTSKQGTLRNEGIVSVEETNQNKRRWFGRSKRKERGASLVLVSGSLVAFVAIAALAVDYGQLVVERRAMVTATDAASLAAATVYASGGIDGCDEALSYMNANAPGHENFSCQYFPETGGGVVEVSSSQTVSFGFGSVLGINSGTAASSTASEFITSTIPGLRPFMLCRSYNQQFSDWIDGTSQTPPNNMTFILADNLNACLVSTGGGGGGGNGGGNGGGGNGGGGGGGGGAGGGGGGNWAVADFDGQSNGTPELRGWIAGGYSGPFETCQDVTCPNNPTICTDDSAACYEGSPGVLSPSVEAELIGITGNGTLSYLPVVREVTDGSGGNLEARVERLVMAELVSYQVLGQSDLRSLTFTFHDATTPVDPAVRICGATATECP